MKMETQTKPLRSGKAEKEVDRAAKEEADPSGSSMPNVESGHYTMPKSMN